MVCLLGVRAAAVWSAARMKVQVSFCCTDTRQAVWRIRRRCGHAPGAFPVDDEQSLELGDIDVLPHIEGAVVKNEPAAVVADRSHGVVLAGAAIADDNEPEVVFGYSDFAQGEIFGNGVILAISGIGRERCQRRRPKIENAILGHVVDRPDVKIDRAIDFCDADPAFLGLRPIQYGQKSLCRRRARRGAGAA